MSRTEYISLDGLRIDGRKPKEVRLIEIACGMQCDNLSEDFDGVAKVVHGLTQVIVCVQGPLEANKQKEKTPYSIQGDSIDIQCQVIFNSDKTNKNPKNERTAADLTHAIRAAFQKNIIAHLYKKSSLHITINVIENDGGLKAAVLNATCIALIDAGIALKDLISSCNVAYLSSSILIDPNQQESNAALVEMTITTYSNSQEIAYLDVKSRHAVGNLEEIIAAGIEGTWQFRHRANAVLQDYAENIIKVNNAIHGN